MSIHEVWACQSSSHVQNVESMWSLMLKNRNSSPAWSSFQSTLLKFVSQTLRSDFIQDEVKKIYVLKKKSETWSGRIKYYSDKKKNPVNFKFQIPCKKQTFTSIIPVSVLSDNMEISVHAFLPQLIPTRVRLSVQLTDMDGDLIWHVHVSITSPLLFLFSFKPSCQSGKKKSLTQKKKKTFHCFF